MLEYKLLSPEESVEEYYPFRRVWRSLLIEMIILLAALIGIIAANRLGFIENVYSPRLSIFLIILPLITFYLVSIRGEVRARQPRQGLSLILITSLIVTNGVAVPIINTVFTPERWLTEAGFFSRIIGHTLSLGILAEFVKYAVVRYTVWPQRFRGRLDGVAYSIPAALGYATILNIHLVLDEKPLLISSAIRILITVYIHIAVGVIMGYFLGELAIGKVTYIWLPLGLVISAFISSVFFAFRQVATVSGLSSRDIGGVFLAIGFSVVILGIVAFLIESADERMAGRLGTKRVR